MDPNAEFSMFIQQDAGLHVRQTFGLQEFEPTWAFITTWRNCHHEDFTDAPLYEGMVR